MLIRAPLEINVHIEPIISIFDIIETPHVAAKKHDALTIIDFAEFSSAYFADSCLFFPSHLASKYLLVINIA